MGEGGMLSSGGMTPADMAAVMGSDNGWGGNGAWWIIVLFALMMGGGNWGWGGRNGYQPQYATQDFVQNGFNFNDLQDQNRDLMGAITAGTAQSVSATNQVFHDMYAVLNDKYDELQRDISGLAVGQANQLAKQQDCCCQTLRAIDGVNYNNAMNTAQITAAIAAEGQATRGMIQQNKIEALQQEVAGLRGMINTQSLRNEIREATDGVVRYPEGFMYNAGPSPFCGNAMGCCNM